MGLKLGADAVKKLLKALQKSDIGDQETFDPETYSEDIYNYILEDFSSVNGFGSEDASYFLEDILGEAENLMQEGIIDDVIESIASGEPDGWIQQVVERHIFEMEPGNKDTDEIINAMQETASDALTYYRDNWLGYHADDILELGVNRVGDEIPMQTSTGNLYKDLGDGVAPAAPQGPTGVLADPMGYPKIPGGMDAARQMPPQEQAFEELLRRYGLLHQF